MFRSNVWWELRREHICWRWSFSASGAWKHWCKTQEFTYEKISGCVGKWSMHGRTKLSVQLFSISKNIPDAIVTKNICILFHIPVEFPLFWNIELRYRISFEDICIVLLRFLWMIPQLNLNEFNRGKVYIMGHLYKRVFSCSKAKACF